MATATVISRIERLSNDTLVGMTVAQIREQFGSVLNISEDATPLINGESVDEEEELVENDELVFSRPVGSKG